MGFPDRRVQGQWARLPLSCGRTISGEACVFSLGTACAGPGLGILFPERPVTEVLSLSELGGHAEPDLAELKPPRGPRSLQPSLPLPPQASCASEAHPAGGRLCVALSQPPFPCWLDRLPVERVQLPLWRAARLGLEARAVVTHEIDQGKIRVHGPLLPASVPTGVPRGRGGKWMSACHALGARGKVLVVPSSEIPYFSTRRRWGSAWGAGAH